MMRFFIFIFFVRVFSNRKLSLVGTLGGQNQKIYCSFQKRREKQKKN